MGLDTIAYKGLQLITTDLTPEGAPIDPETGEEMDEDLYLKVWVNPNFPERARDLVNGGFYSVDDRVAGWAGPYSMHVRYREMLAQLVGYKPVRRGDVGYDQEMDDISHTAGACVAGAGPFYELIWFADNEGIIGPADCGKLAAEFAEWDARAKAMPTLERDRFDRWYDEFRRAFEFAAGGAGAVLFN